MSPAEAYDWLEERLPYDTGTHGHTDRDALAVLDSAVAVANTMLDLWAHPHDDALLRDAYRSAARLTVIAANTKGADV